jgi:hypothetical protein
MKWTLAPREDLPYDFAAKPLDADSAIALDTANAAAGERLQLFRSEVNRRPFHADGPCIS